MSPTPSSFLNGRVVAAVVLQVVGYAALLVLVPHGSPTALVESLSAVPPVVLIPLAVLALPATVLAVVSGVALGAVGVAPQSIPAIALTRGDVLFFLGAYLVGVAAAWADRRPTATA
ncbi:hypothetical protein [Natronomonas marina]|jgi:hypothetical protein|uniref:hypothetical protein n=1 Tax=Natronomonas marina TaxID=2961939 RepID=UPI0020C9F388|nr:hypothetical protein [Natronomonas marina]